MRSVFAALKGLKGTVAYKGLGDVVLILHNGEVFLIVLKVVHAENPVINKIITSHILTSMGIGFN